MPQKNENFLASFIRNHPAVARRLAALADDQNRAGAQFRTLWNKTDNGNLGILDSTEGMLHDSIPAILDVGANLSDVSGIPVVSGGLSDLQRLASHYLRDKTPEEFKGATDRYARLNKKIKDESGITPAHTLEQHLAESAGDMLGQLPIGFEGESSSALKKALTALPEYLGPTIRMSGDNYLAGTIGGGLLGKLFESNEDSNPVGYATGGEVGMSDPRQLLDSLTNAAKEHNQQALSTAATTTPVAGTPEAYAASLPSQQQGNPLSQDWYNTYGFGPEHDFGTASLSPSNITGYAAQTGTPSAGNASGMSVMDMLKAYKNGKNIYNLYEKYFGSDDAPTGQGVNTNQTTNGQTINDQFSNPTSSNPGSSLAGSIGAGAVGAGSIGSTLGGTTGSVIVSDPATGEVLSGLGSGAGAGSAAGAGSSVAGSTAGSTAGDAAGSTAGSTLGATLGTVAGFLAILNMAYGDEAYGSHNVSGTADPNLGQTAVHLTDPTGGNTSIGDIDYIKEGNMAIGTGNDSSKGSGQLMIVNPDNQLVQWIGDSNPTYQSAEKALQNLYQINNSGDQYFWKDGYQSGIPISSLQPSTIQGFLKNGTLITKDQAQQNYINQLQDVYNTWGGADTLGTDFYNWASQLSQLIGSVSGSPHGATGGYLKDGDFDDQEYANGGKVEKLLKMIEILGLNPHQTKTLKVAGSITGDPVEDIKYFAHEAKSQGKITPETQQDLSDLMQKYLSNPDIPDETMGDSLLDLHRSLFGTAGDHVPANLKPVSDIDPQQLVPEAFGVLKKLSGGYIRS